MIPPRIEVDSKKTLHCEMILKVLCCKGNSHYRCRCLKIATIESVESVVAEGVARGLGAAKYNAPILLCNIFHLAEKLIMLQLIIKGKRF